MLLVVAWVFVVSSPVEFLHRGWSLDCCPAMRQFCLRGSSKMVEFVMFPQRSVSTIVLNQIVVGHILASSRQHPHTVWEKTIFEDWLIITVSTYYRNETVWLTSGLSGSVSVPPMWTCFLLEVPVLLDKQLFIPEGGGVLSIRRSLGEDTEKHQQLEHIQTFKNAIIKFEVCKNHFTFI